jgi:hypothetical protein
MKKNGRWAAFPHNAKAHYIGCWGSMEPGQGNTSYADSVCNGRPGPRRPGLLADLERMHWLNAWRGTEAEKWPRCRERV